VDQLLVFALLVLAGAVLALGLGLIFVYRRGERVLGEAAYGGAALESLTREQRELAGRVSQLAESTAEAQTRLSKTLEDRLDKVSERMGASLEQTATKAAKTMTELQSRLAVIDEAQKNITELSGQVVGLQDILANKQARGTFGEVQLNDLVRNALPPSAYEFQATLANGRRADCLIRLPNPPGPIVVDAKFPLESYRALRDAGDEAARVAAARAFTQDIQKHVNDIAERYILPGETAESALMFLPSEAVYAELHASFPNVVERSYRSRVWIVSPTTLMATLNTVRAVLKDARMREQAGLIQKEVFGLLQDVRRLDDRIGKLQRHFDQAADDIRQARISTEKITRKAERIDEARLADVDDEGAAADLAPSPAAARLTAE